MITDGLGRDLFPPDNTQDGQAGAQEGGAEPADAAQEVRLEEYRGWSQGTRSRENGGVQERLRTREADAWGRAPKTVGGPLPRGLPSPRGKQAKEAGQGDLAEHVGTRWYPRPRSGCHTLRSGGEHGRGPGRYHPRRKGRPPTPRPRLVEAAGTEVGRVGEGEARAERSEHSRRAGSPFPTQEGCRDHCS
jgi:hypothetical protein